jgi:beta-mannosidase
LRNLHDGWTLSGASQDIRVPATVPGCVHTDLLAAGLIEDPYLAGNEEGLAWIGRADWVYDTTFSWRPDGHDRTDLVCRGLDTVATVVLNGVVVGGTANQHRSYRFDVRELLREGENTLAVRFGSPYAYAERLRSELGARPGAYGEPYQFIRKMACNFGWDWGPTLVTAGIWRPIGLSSWSGARLSEVRPLVTMEGRDGRVDVHVTVERAHDGPLTVTAEVAGVSTELRLAPGETSGVLTLSVPEPERWHPRGYGGQRRHPLTVTLGDEVWRREIGFRSVRLDQTGGAFTLHVNGEPVFVRGVNWIPDDCFPNRVTRERLAERFEQAAAANVNLLRVWGGGLYESEDFYDLADEMGLLVWQDFPFACAAYPEEEPFAAEVEAEARENVARLAWRPSLALWCGNNENLEGHADWGWQDELAGRTWGGGFYHGLLPRVVAELDPTRPYWPGSPYSGDPDLPPNDPARGTTHIWDVWNDRDYTGYAAYRPRFVAEFGFQGPPAHATLRRAAPAGPLTPASAHQKAVDGMGKLLRGLGDHLPPPADFDDWHYYTQLNQARAMSFGIERFRSQAPHCMGTVVWQLNDCWPVTSWAAVDGDGRRKPLWYALRRVFADRLVTIQDGSVVVLNDGPHPWSGDLSVVRRSLAGEPLAKESFPVLVGPRGKMTVDLPGSLTEPGDAAREVLTARLGETTAVRFYTEDPEVDFPPAAFVAVAERVEGGVRVRVTATTVLRDLALFPDRLDPGASVDAMLCTLLPGESAVFHVTSAAELDLAALTSRPVLRCVNEGVPGGARSLPGQG